MDEEFVSMKEYENLLRDLQNERAAHLTTKTKLAVTSEKLEFALGEIDILNKQLRKEKEVFHQSFSHLKESAFEQKYHALHLKQKYEDIERVVEEKENKLQVSEGKIQDLKGRIMEQKKTHQKQLDDNEIHLMQERYIAQHCLGGQSSTSRLKRNERRGIK